ncbi:MAG: hypothetical protein ACJ8F1_23145 [Polyangia bacterium]
MTDALIVVLVAGLLGCSSGSLQSPSGAGGTGAGGTGGGGAGGSSSGGSSNGGASPDGSTCVAGEMPDVIPWTVVFRAADAGSSHAGAGGADAGSSGCHKTTNLGQTDTACAGPAWLQADTGKPTIAWDDGAQLVWAATGGNPGVSPPAVAANGQRVWASFSETFHIICAFCGATDTILIEVRESQGGKLLFLAQRGRNLPEPTGDQVLALFGVDADTRAVCSSAGIDNCMPVVWTQNDHLLRTTPAQVIPWGTPTTVGAPNGRFDVIWYSSSERQTGPAYDCTDSGATGPFMGFVASRVASPAL